MVRLFFLLSLSLLITGCGDQPEQETPEYEYVVEHERFTARFPLAPQHEPLPYNENRYLLVTSEITYLVHAGHIRPEMADRLNAMSENEALEFIITGIRQGLPGIQDHTTDIIKSDGYTMIDFTAPEVDNPVGDYLWVRLYLVRDDLIQVILSSPEKRLVEREKQAFMDQFTIHP
jgi:hypothetical protein